jgi:NTE family protein
VSDSSSQPVRPGLAISLSSSFFGFYCHAGFMAELHRQGIFPEQIAGASSGALTAVLCGTGLQGRALEEFIFQPGVRRSVFDWGWLWRLPGIFTHTYGTGILSGNNIVRYLNNKFGKRRIEDMRCPRVQIAVTNLTDKRLDMVSEGDAFEYAVASSAVPGLFQARRVDGRLCCDGGTVDVNPFEHWLAAPDVETIVLHEIVHEADSRPKAPGGATNFTVAMALCHEIMSDQLLSYRLRLAEGSGKRVIHIRTMAPHPGFFPRHTRHILQQRGRESAMRLCDQLREVTK